MCCFWRGDADGWLLLGVCACAAIVYESFQNEREKRFLGIPFDWNTRRYVSCTQRTTSGVPVLLVTDQRTPSLPSVVREALTMTPIAGVVISRHGEFRSAVSRALFKPPFRIFIGMYCVNVSVCESWLGVTT